MFLKFIILYERRSELPFWREKTSRRCVEGSVAFVLRSSFFVVVVVVVVVFFVRRIHTS